MRLDLRHLVDAHHLVGVEVLLLDAAVLHRASRRRARPTGRRRRSLRPARAICSGLTAWPGSVAATMRWILSLPSSSTETSAQPRRSCRSPCAARGREARPAGAGLPQPIALGDRVQHREVLRVLRHQLAAERERILPGRMRQLVHEALEIDRVLVEVDAAPEARRHRRIAHGVVDQQVRDRVADDALRPAGVEPLEGRRVAPVLEALRAARRRGSTGRRCACAARSRLPFASSAPDQLALRDRMVVPVQHVLLARPDQLDRRAGHLLGDQHRLAHVVVAGAAPAEAAAEMESCRPRIGRSAGRRPRPPRRAPPRRSASALQTSQRSGVQSAVAFIGSMVAWFWYG